MASSSKHQQPSTASVGKSNSSPDIGRKHHTLPHNYKHPPQLKIQRNSSSSSGESGVTNKKLKSNKYSERKRRTGTNERLVIIETVASLYICHHNVLALIDEKISFDI